MIGKAVRSAKAEAAPTPAAAVRVRTVEKRVNIVRGGREIRSTVNVNETVRCSRWKAKKKRQETSQEI